jgi:hypothetical protein
MGRGYIDGLLGPVVELVSDQLSEHSFVIYNPLFDAVGENYRLVFNCSWTFWSKMFIQTRL